MVHILYDPNNGIACPTKEVLLEYCSVFFLNSYQLLYALSHTNTLALLTQKLSSFSSIQTIKICLLYNHREDTHKKNEGGPETKGVEEGSAKRNIVRKHHAEPGAKEKKNHGGAGGKGKWNEMDDGSMP